MLTVLDPNPCLLLGKLLLLLSDGVRQIYATIHRDPLRRITNHHHPPTRNFTKSQTLAQVCPCEFYEICKNAFCY